MRRLGYRNGLWLMLAPFLLGSLVLVVVPAVMTAGFAFTRYDGLAPADFVGWDTYRALLDHVRPAELLGLTATPERSDGLPVLDWFSGRIAAELRLWDAIDQHRLVPFTYYGVHDGLDLRDIPWRRGRGYDVDSLSNLFTSNDAWARLMPGGT